MQPSPFTPEFQEEISTFQSWIEEQCQHNQEVKSFADRLESDYGSLDYGVFAVYAGQWILESWQREIQSLLSYGEKIFSGQTKSRRSLNSDAITKQITEFQESYADLGKQFVNDLHEKLGSIEKVATILWVTQEIVIYLDYARKLLDIIENSSPKAREKEAKELQVRFVAFRDACLAAHDSLKSHYPETLGILQDNYLRIRKYPGFISPEDALTNTAMNRLRQWTRALNSAESRLKPDYQLYELGDLKNQNTWKKVSKIKNLPSRLQDEDALNWEKENTASSDELELFAYTGEKPRGRYKTRRNNEVALFLKYLKPMHDLLLQHSLNPFSDFSSVLLPLIDTLHNHAEFIKILDIVLLNKN